MMETMNVTVINNKGIYEVKREDGVTIFETPHGIEAVYSSMRDIEESEGIKIYVIEVKNNESYKNNGDVRKAIEKGLKYVDDYRLSVTLMSTFDNEGDNKELQETTLSIFVDDLDNDDNSFEISTKYCENIVQRYHDVDELQRKALRDEQRKLYNYLSKHFDNVDLTADCIQ